jgi:exonuclease SbcC
MIPLRLKISGFLSYRDPVEVDFTTFQLACISGQNGAGKSSLLDAITWSLFGQARKRDETLINTASEAAEVALTFAYEQNIYRVQRILPRGKTTLLEFQIFDDEQRTINDQTNPGLRSMVHGQGKWRPLTEATSRATQARIESILRLDYETFVNASFFLQGKADQFTQQKASERKRILASILGLEQWEIYKERTAERRKSLEREVDTLDGRLAEVNAELGEAEERKAKLKGLETQLKELTATRQTQETALEQIKKLSAALAEQRKLVETLESALERSRRELSALSARLAAREAEAATHAALVRRAADVVAAYGAWQAAREALAKWDSAAEQFREAEKRRQPFLDEIQIERARLEQEKQSLSNQFLGISEQSAEIENLKIEIENIGAGLAAAEAKVTLRAELDGKLRLQRERFVEIDGENRRLKVEMDELKARIDRISQLDGATCPLCGQALTEAHRVSTLEQLSAEGTEKGNRWRTNKADRETLAAEIQTLEAQLKTLASAENERVRFSAQHSSLSERLETATKATGAWESGGKKRLAEVESQLNGESFARAARSNLSKLDAELAATGYDPAAHEAARLAEQTGRAAEAELRALEAAKAALAPLEREMEGLRGEIGTRESEIGQREAEFAEAEAALNAAEAQSPNLQEAENAFYELKERENVLNQQLGMAQQLVTVLESRRKQKKQYEAGREELALEIGRHKTLERAFGKDGVPALLIEQALPQIEEKANELLDRLSNGTMSVRFVTQAEYKDKKRDDLKETLDIQISDGAGTRDYEMFSGGEAFRVNFALRLALSEILARRTGARLQTLVIDEGFGSQDALGRQRLIEAINQVRGDFEKILIITHLEELKEAFPNRIEVEKTVRGSSVRIM